MPPTREDRSMGVLSGVPDTAIAGFVGAIVGALGREVVEFGKRKWRRTTRAREAFRVSFVQEAGANICTVAHEDTERREEIPLQAYRVQVAFDLWSDRPVSLRNVDLSYDWPSSLRAEQHVWVGGETGELALDASFRLRYSIPLQPGDALRLRVNRRFLTPDFFTSDWDEYRVVTARCELASEEGGLELLTISGRLRPGGKVEDVEQALRSDDERARGVATPKRS
jgi:hypothetical protein